LNWSVPDTGFILEVNEKFLDLLQTTFLTIFNVSDGLIDLKSTGLCVNTIQP